MMAIKSFRSQTLLFVLASIGFIGSQATARGQGCPWDTSQTGKITETCGNLGIGTTTPSQLVHVQTPGTSGNTGGIAVSHGTDTAGGAAGLLLSGTGNYGFLDYDSSSSNGVRLSGLGPLRLGNNTNAAYGSTVFTEAMRITGGTIGIGTTSPTAMTSIVKAGGNLLDARFNSATKAIGFASTATAGQTFIDSNLHYSSGNVFTVDQAGDYYAMGNPGGAGNVVWVVYTGNATAGSSVDFGSVPPQLAVDKNGNVGIGTGLSALTTRLRVEGDAVFHGNVTGNNIAAQYQDLAEWVPTKGHLVPGTVVVIDESLGNGVVPSARAYDTRVAGVVSAQPGLLLGKAGEGKAAVATTGRVRVKVDSGSAAINIGDLLVTSDRPGYAMKSEPIEVAGVAIHRPGTLIGKALEPLEVGRSGEILVLLSLQ